MSKTTKSITISALDFKDDRGELVLDLTLRCSSRNTVAITSKLSLILRSPLDLDKVKYQSKESKILERTINTKPGKNQVIERMSLIELEPLFKESIQDILAGRQTSYPHWQLNIVLKESDGAETTQKAFLPAPEDWFWRFS